MEENVQNDYYLPRRHLIFQEFDRHAKSWQPFLAADYGHETAAHILSEAKREEAEIIATLPYIGGDSNPMTRHLIRSGTSLALYKAMRAEGKSDREVGRLIYRSVCSSVRKLPSSSFVLTKTFIAKEKKRAKLSRQRQYPGDWVWEFVAGTDVYGYDFLECGTQKWYAKHDALEFLPFYCFLDFVTHRTRGWGFHRTKTLSEGSDRCNFRWIKGGSTIKGWPPPFLRE